MSAKEQPFNLSPHNKQFLYAKIEALDLSEGWQVVIRKKKTKRTEAQNNRLWDLYTALGEYLGEFKDDVHELMGYKFLRYQKEINGVQVELIRSTTELSTKEMGEYQDSIEMWAAQIGFVWDEQ